MTHRTTSRTITRIVSIITVGFIAGAVALSMTRSDAGAAEAPGAPTRVAEPTPTAEEQEIIDWAFELYETAGMDLPPVEIGFYRTKEPCHGSKGQYVPQPDGPPKVRVCDWHEKEMLRDAWRRKTLVHELAHAWTALNVDEARRERFGALRGTETWNDPAFPWERRAIEHASEVIAWGLIDRPVRIDLRMENRECRELAEAFRFLTGSEPVNGLTHSC